jgi:hypothetical protein
MSDRPRQTAPREGGGTPTLDQQETERVRHRVELLVQITSRAGAYRRGLLAAARHLSPEEATIINDLEAHGMQVPQLRDMLRGGHVLVDDPGLYENWQFAKVSHQRLSSHHHDIDKARYPDYGMRGQVVREKLHGRTERGTWVQLEKTPATFGKGKRPSLNDVRHLVDYVVYRVTRSNVGPWGLSRQTERHPMYLSPDLSVPQPLQSAVADALSRTLRKIEETDDQTAVSQDLARRFPPPERVDPRAELGSTLTGNQGGRYRQDWRAGRGGGRGLFGNSEVWVAETRSSTAAAVLGRSADEHRNLWSEVGVA